MAAKTKRNLIVPGAILLIALLLGLHCLMGQQGRDDTLLIAAVYPPNYQKESHRFVVRRGGTVDVTMGERRLDGDDDIGAIITGEFIEKPAQAESFRLAQEDLEALVQMAERLDSLGAQAKKYEQIGWYVGAVYYNGTMHEFNFVDSDSDPAAYADDPAQVVVANEIASFLIERSPIAFSRDAWWF